MIKKGIILAGGTGSRMSPITKAVNKQLLPIYDKPLIYYPLSVLMLAKIKNILIIVNKGQVDQFKKVLPDGKNLGIKIEYAEQEKPAGLPDAFIVGEKFIGEDSVSLILGDNFFFGQSLTKKLINSTKLIKGSKVFLHPVKNPSLYGVATINKKNKIINISEKPKNTKSNLAVTGLYFFDNNVVKYSKELKVSKRNELEISDLNKLLVKKKVLKQIQFGRGITWMDAGTEDSLIDTSQFIQSIQNRSLYKISCPEEIAFKKGWISKKGLKLIIKEMPSSPYSKYLKDILDNSY